MSYFYEKITINRYVSVSTCNILIFIFIFWNIISIYANTASTHFSAYQHTFLELIIMCGVTNKCNPLKLIIGTKFKEERC